MKELLKSNPGYLDQTYMVLLTKSIDQFDIGLLVAALSQNAKMGFTTIQSLDTEC